MRKFSFLFAQSDYGRKAFKFFCIVLDMVFSELGRFMAALAMNSGILTVRAVQWASATLRRWENTIVLFGWVASRFGRTQTSQLELDVFDVRGWWSGSRAEASANIPSRLFCSNTQIRLFFSFFGSTASNQLFISSFIGECVFAKWFEVEHSDLSCRVFCGFSHRLCLLCILCIHTAHIVILV